MTEDDLLIAFDYAREQGDEDMAIRIAGEIDKIRNTAPVDELGAMRDKIAEETSTLDALLIGAGKTFDTVGANLQMLFNSGERARGYQGFIPQTKEESERASTIAKEKNAPILKEQKEKKGLYGHLQDAKPIATFAGEIAPSLLIAPASISGAAVSGGAIGALESDENNLRNAAVAATLSAIPLGIGKAINKSRTKLAEPAAEYAEQAGILEKAGIPLTSGQKTGTNWLKASERTLADIPVSGAPVQKTFETQQRAYQKNLLEMAGLDDGSDLITSKTLEKTRKSLESKYKNALSGKSLDMADGAFIDDLARIEATHSKYLPFEQKKGVRDVIEGLLDEAAELESKGGKLDADAYQRIRSNLGKKASSTKNSYQSALYDDLKSALDGLFEREAGSAKFDIDKQYAQYRQLQGIYERIGGPAMSEGYISPVQVAKEASKSPGSKEWKDFTRAASAVLPDRLGNSGTAQRNYMLTALGSGQGLGAIIDPLSLIYGPMAGRASAEMLSRGITPTLPSVNPRIISAGGSQSYVTAQNR